MIYEWFDQLVCHLLMSTAPAGGGPWLDAASGTEAKKTLLLHCSKFPYSQDQDLRLTVRPCMKSATPDGPVVRERHNRATQGTQLVQVDGPRSAASEDSPASRDRTKRRVLNALPNATRQWRTDRDAACLQTTRTSALHHGAAVGVGVKHHETSDTGAPAMPPNSSPSLLYTSRTRVIPPEGASRTRQGFRLTEAH